MSRIASLGVGDWTMLALYGVIVLGGLYQLVFAARLREKEEERLRRQGEYDGGGYQPNLLKSDPRTMGPIFIAAGAGLILWTLARNGS
jgi:hypothetical protein